MKKQYTADQILKMAVKSIAVDPGADLDGDMERHWWPGDANAIFIQHGRRFGGMGRAIVHVDGREKVV